MKNEIVRWAKPPRLVPAELVARKDSVALKDYPWVYAAPLTMLATLPWWVLTLIWISGPFTLQGWGITWFVFNSIILLLSVCMSAVRLVSPNGDPFSEKTDAPLNYHGRKKLCQLEQNRKRAVQKGDRPGRYCEADHKYPQFSVWSEPIKNGVQLRIVEHIPRHFGPFSLKYKVKTAAYQGRLAVNWYEDPSLDELTENFTQYEQIALQLEDKGYTSVTSSFENTRNALMVRR